MGRGHVNYAGTRLVAVCDVDKNHLELGKKLVKEKIAAYHDFRDLILDPNVDIVHIATPPHWHGIMSVEAAKAGKDIWCEKPMTRTIGEGKRVMEAVQQYGRMFRLNTWFRFTDQFYGLGTPVQPLKKLVQSGLLGWPLKVTISAHTGFNWKFFWVGKEYLEPQPVPAELDYDMWLGPAPYKPYNPHRVHQTFRGYWDYDGGGLGDMGQHYIDPVQYILGKDDTSPIKVEVDAPQQHRMLSVLGVPLPTRMTMVVRLSFGGGTSVIRIRRILPDRRVMYIKILYAIFPIGRGNLPISPNPNLRLRTL